MLNCRLGSRKTCCKRKRVWWHLLLGPVAGDALLAKHPAKKQRGTSAGMSQFLQRYSASSASAQPVSVR